MTFDSPDRGGVFKVHTKHGITEFVRHAKGFYYIRARIRTSTQQNNGDNTEWSFMIETIRCNYEGFTRKEIECAYGVRCL